MTPDELDQAVRPLLSEVAVMTLATCADGSPWASDVYFAADGLDLVFYSSPRSRHCRNLAANPACAASIHPPAASWREIRGIQAEGIVEPLSGAVATAKAIAIYLAKFPFARDLLTHPAAATGAAIGAFARASLYVLKPSRLFYLDNRLGIGARFGIDVVDGRAAGPPRAERRE